MMSLSSSRHLLILALRFRSSSGFVIFLYWWVRDMGTSSPELGDPSDTNPAPAPAPAPGCCSGLLSVELLRLPPRLVLVTRCAAAAAARPGENAENGDCQFMVRDNGR